MRKSLATVMMMATLSTVFVLTSHAAQWRNDTDGYRYQYDDSSFAQGGIKAVDGLNYCFDVQGYRKTGWQYISSRWYFFDAATGAQAMEWKEIEGNWYYFESDNAGTMHTGWLDIGKKRYYCNESGVMQTGVFYLPDNASGATYAYQADESGVLIRNFVKENGNRTIMYDANGVMLYRNNTTRQVSNAEGGSVWQYVLSEADMYDQQETNKAIILTAVQEKQDALYDDYCAKVKTSRTSSYEKKLSDWKEKVHRELAINLSVEEVDSFIQKVCQGRFCKFRDRDPNRDEQWYDDFYCEYDDNYYYGDYDED